MRSILAVLFATIGAMVLASPVCAQATRTWVSGVGDDANPCSRTAPCKTFAGAFSKTASGGEINCLDAGGFGALTLTRSMTVSCESVEAGVLVAGTNGINISAGQNDTIVLRGLDIYGSSGFDGIKFNTGAALHVERCTIRGFTGSPGNGIHFAPSSASQLVVLDTIISDNNKSSTSAGVLVQPTGTGTAAATIEKTSVSNNGNGLVVDGSLSTGAQIVVVFHASIASGNAANGIRSVSAAGKSPSRIIVTNAAATGNGTGISSSGQGADVTLAYSTVSGNSTGLLFTAPGEIRSYQTNQLRGNTGTNGAPSTPLPLE